MKNTNDLNVISDAGSRTGICFSCKSFAILTRVEDGWECSNCRETDVVSGEWTDVFGGYKEFVPNTLMMSTVTIDKVKSIVIHYPGANVKCWIEDKVLGSIWDPWHKAVSEVFRDDTIRSKFRALAKIKNDSLRKPNIKVLADIYGFNALKKLMAMRRECVATTNYWLKKNKDGVSRFDIHNNEIKIDRGNATTKRIDGKPVYIHVDVLADVNMNCGGILFFNASTLSKSKSSNDVAFSKAGTDARLDGYWSGAKVFDWYKVHKDIWVDIADMKVSIDDATHNLHGDAVLEDMYNKGLLNDKIWDELSYEGNVKLDIKLERMRASYEAELLESDDSDDFSYNEDKEEVLWDLDDSEVPTHVARNQWDLLASEELNPEEQMIANEEEMEELDSKVLLMKKDEEFLSFYGIKVSSIVRRV